MSAITVNVFPTEILLNVFKHLDPQTLTCSRRVCRRWKEIIESQDKIWKELCEDYWKDYEDAFNKSQLTWCELYNSLTLWAKVKTADVRVRKFDRAARTSEFQLLPNGVICFPQFNRQNDEVRSCLSYNTLVYYDLHSLKQCHREMLNFYFVHYSENASLIAMIDNNAMLCVIIKENKCVTQIAELTKDKIDRKEVYYFLFDKEVYFIDSSYNFCVSSLQEKDSVLTMETKVIDLMPDFIAMARVNDTFNIFTRGYIYSLENNEFVEEDFVSQFLFEGIFDMLEKYGFNWTDQHVHDWLTTAFDDDIIRLSRFRNATVCGHGNVLILGTSRQMIHVFKNSPCGEDGNLRFSNAKPIVSFDLKKLIQLSCLHSSKSIDKIGVVETENGHKIILCYLYDIFVIDLIHNETGTGDKKTTKKKSDAKTMDGKNKKRKIK